MERKPYFPMLEAEISKNGITKKYIAEKIGISPRSLSCKLAGKTDLWWKEIQVIQSIFPNVPAEQLFSRDL